MLKPSVHFSNWIYINEDLIVSLDINSLMLTGLSKSIMQSIGNLYQDLSIEVKLLGYNLKQLI